ncbi:hypothetical protein [Desulfomonile tiedjei]|uniref:Uncharacterized protein n=1 Tax=Desulfomonile tiedjei (strain ATCC 49306 / DSM 6799 / DCB-1) TaxID=706587 RepID=I4CAW5_DESTA|nr:hypothetical protein [Desulfomonile tiedjei]AFM26706.1 hypothetical protein Desti_4067 [Desulfomonile tiedjei DSM 6799]
MDYNLLLIVSILILGIGGFTFLALTILANWRMKSRDTAESDARYSRLSRDFENCYENCMREEKWDRDKEEECDSRCRLRLAGSYSLPD